MHARRRQRALESMVSDDGSAPGVEASMLQGMTSPAASRAQARHATMRETHRRKPSVPQTGALTARRTSRLGHAADAGTANAGRAGIASRAIRQSNSMKRSNSTGQSLSRLDTDLGTELPATPRDGRGRPLLDTAASAQALRSPVTTRMRTPRGPLSSPLSDNEQQRGVRTTAWESDQSDASTPRSLLTQRRRGRASTSMTPTPRASADSSARTPRRRSSLSLEVQAGSAQGITANRRLPLIGQTAPGEHRHSPAMTSRREAHTADAERLAASFADAGQDGHNSSGSTSTSVLTAVVDSPLLSHVVASTHRQAHERHSACGAQSRSDVRVDGHAELSAGALDMTGRQPVKAVVQQYQAVPSSGCPELEPPTPSPQPYSHGRESCSSTHAQQPFTPAHVLQVSKCQQCCIMA